LEIPIQDVLSVKASQAVDNESSRVKAPDRHRSIQVWDQKEPSAECDPSLQQTVYYNSPQPHKGNTLFDTYNGL
jgi:hypothetical protein